MEAVGAAANIIAIVDLSAKVATRCVQYSKDVASAREDIERLRNQVDQMAAALQAKHRLVEGTKGSSLPISQGLAGSFSSCIADLERLKNKLDPSTARSTMRRFGMRALKWPFNSKEVDQLLAGLRRYEGAILLGLQVDQTAMLIDIQEGVKQLGLRPTEMAPVSPKRHRLLPFTPNPDFVHRPEIEKWMRDQYSQPGQRLALVGLGGFGKSQLAIQFAYDIYATDAGLSVFWVRSSSKAAFEESYRALADVLELPRRHEPTVNVLALVRDWLQRDDVGPWLMIVDNADDMSVFTIKKGHDNAVGAAFASYLPKSTKGKILVTSRSLEVAERLVGSSQATLRIPIMLEEQASGLLQRRLAEQTDEDAALNLVRALDCIPLAVNQAAAYINRRSPRVTVKSYLDDFRTSEKLKDSLLRSDKGDLGRNDDVSNSVVVTWQVTFEQIKRERPRATNLLSLMSQFQAQNIPEMMLHGYGGDNEDATPEEEGHMSNVDTGSKSDRGSEQMAFEDDLDVLRGYSLVTIPGAGLFEMHPLVQLCTRSWISEFGDPARWSLLFVSLAADHFPSGAFETWATCQSLLPHIEPILGREPTEESLAINWVDMLGRVSHYLLLIGQYSRAEVLARAVVAAKSRGLGLDHPDTLISKTSLARIYMIQGHGEEAVKLQDQVATVSRTKLGLDHPSTRAAMANLASIHRDLAWQYNNKRWLGTVEEIQMLVMDICKSKLGLDNPETIASMSELALTLWNQDRLNEAEALQVEVMEWRKAKFGPDHRETVASMANLASTLCGQGRLEDAETLQVEVMEWTKAKLGPDHRETVASMANLARTWHDQGRLEEAETLRVEVLKWTRANIGLDHPLALGSMGNLAHTWHDQGRLEESLNLMTDCVRLCQETLGQDHPQTQSNLARLQSWQAESPTPYVVSGC